MWKKIFLSNLLVVFFSFAGWRTIEGFFGSAAKEYMLIIMAFTLVLAGLLAAVAAHVISRNLEILAENVNRYVKKIDNKLIKAPSPILRDEVSSIEDSLVKIIEEHTSMVEEVGSSQRQEAEITKDIQKLLVDARQLSEDIQTVIDEVFHRAEEQQKEIGAANQTIIRMASLLGESSSAAKEGARTAKLATEAAKNGSIIAQRAVERIQGVFATFEQSGAEVMQFSVRSRQIDKVSAVIAHIARQTNLLALNASIEAARAGTHGHGFAQVAEEIRKLSASTDKSAERIASLVEEIIKESQDALNAIEEGTGHLSEGREELSSMLKSLEHVGDRVNENARVLEPVFNNSSQQLVEADNASETISRALDIAKKNTQTTEDGKKISQMQLKLIERAADLSAQLSALSKEFESKMKTYKV